MTYDVMIKNGTIIDGTGTPSYVGDVAISGDKVAAVGRHRRQGEADHRCGGSFGDPRVYRHPYASRCSDFLGPNFDLVVLARGNLGGDG